MIDEERPDGPQDENGENVEATPPAEEEATGDSSQLTGPGADGEEEATADSSQLTGPGADGEEAPETEAPETEAPPAEAEPPPAEPAAEAEAEPAEEPTADSRQPTADEQPEERPRRERKPREQPDKPDVVPGAHLEPDLVLEEQAQADTEFPGYEEDFEGQPDAAQGEVGEGAAGAEQPAARTPLDLAADARYQATGKRKTSVARVILRPGSGSYTINGRTLDEFFPRPTLQRTARQPLETAGYETRMDVIAKIHGGGVSSQADALRHGVARALVEADPNLRTELKRRGFLTRDARVKERKKAGLKKARKRPQFSKR
jgi:small subunit ribosomal protein S9